MLPAGPLPATTVREGAAGSGRYKVLLREWLWDEIDALAGGADDLGIQAVQHPPTLRLQSLAGSRALSRQRVDLHQVDEAADTIDAAIAEARCLPHPDPAVDALASAATGDGDWWSDYFERTHRAAAAAWERRLEYEAMAQQSRQSR